MSIEHKLHQIVKRHQEIAAILVTPPTPDSQTFAKLSKEYADLTPLVEIIDRYQKARQELADLQTLLQDPEMKTMAQEDSNRLREVLPQMEQQIQLLLLPKDEADEKNAILEVRAGTGGEEAALFAADLFRMYMRYADTRR
nr:PCRF domain-containing protein [Alphaproteobacteria bacterium]